MNKYENVIVNVKIKMYFSLPIKRRVSQILKLGGVSIGYVIATSEPADS